MLSNEIAARLRNLTPEEFEHALIILTNAANYTANGLAKRPWKTTLSQAYWRKASSLLERAYVAIHTFRQST